MNQPRLTNPISRVLIAVFVMSGALIVARNALAQQTTPRATDGGQAARNKILESDRWRRTERELNEWLSIQQLYSPEQVAAMQREIRDRVAKMSPRELEDFLVDMEERLEVLTSAEAEDARQWLAQFLAVARNPEAQLGRPLPDVARMTASQIRQEIQWLNQFRASRQQAHSAAAGARHAQVQAARGVQDARRQTKQQTLDRSSWPANTPRPRSDFAPVRPLPTRPTGRPLYGVSPWGTPILWNPMIGYW